MSEKSEGNEVENTNALIALAAAAGKAAYSEAKAVGIPKVFATEKFIIVETADGKREVISTAAAENKEAYFLKYQHK